MGKLIYGLPDKNIMIARCFDNGKGLKDCFEKLTDIGFGPVNFCGYMMKYSYKDMKKAEGFKKMSMHKELLNILKPLSSVSQEYVDKLTTENTIQRACLESREIDRDLSMVLVEQEQITAIMYVTRIGDKDYDAPMAFLNEKTRYELAIPFLITAATLRIEQLYGEDYNILLCPSFEKGHDGFLAAFGKPLAETRVHDYSIAFRDPSEASMIQHKLEAAQIDFEGGEDFMEPYYDEPELGFISVASALRIPYITDMRKMSKEQLAYTKRELKRWFDKWELPCEKYWRKVVFDCGKTGGTINSLTIGRIYNKSCERLLIAVRNSKQLPPLEPIDYTKEQISYCILPDEEEELYEVLPEHLKDRMFERDFMVIAAYTSNKEIVGIAVTDSLDELLEDGKIAYIRYSFVLPGTGSNNINCELLQISARMAYESGCKAVFVKSFAESEKLGLYDINEPLVMYTREGEFSEANIVTFSIKQLFESELLAAVDARKLDLPKVEYPQSPDSAVLREFAARVRKQGFFFDPDNYDPEFTGFVFDGWKITAAIFAKQVSGREVAISDIYIETKGPEENFRLALFASVLQKAAAELPDDAVLIMKINNRHHLEAIEKMVGPAITNNVVRESFRVFNDEMFTSPIDGEAYAAPEGLSVERCFVAKLMASMMLYGGQKDFDYICALLVDTSAQYPCRDIYKYILTTYAEYIAELEDEEDNEDIDDIDDVDEDVDAEEDYDEDEDDVEEDEEDVIEDDEEDDVEDDEEDEDEDDDIEDDE